MNVHATDLPSPVKDTIRALVSLAHYQSRRSVQYAQWAAEAHRAGMADTAARWRDRSTRYRCDAKWHLNKARDGKELALWRLMHASK